jgi:hypothetical protein
MTLFNICRGEDFRPKCKYLGDLTCIFPNAAHLPVTATATPTYGHAYFGASSELLPFKNSTNFTPLVSFGHCVVCSSSIYDF